MRPTMASASSIAEKLPQLPSHVHEHIHPRHARPGGKYRAESVTSSGARVEFAGYPSDFETVDLCAAHDPAAVINPRYCGAEIEMKGR